MARQSLIWTTLPNGLTPDGRGVRISVLLSPRLDAEGDPQQLSSFFPDWEDWPATLAQATFEIDYGGVAVAIPAAQTIGPNRVDTSLGAADSIVWKALFPGHLFVRGFTFNDLSAHHVLSYDTSALMRLVQRLYGKLARAANGNMPRVTDIVDDADWKVLVDAVASIDAIFFDEKTRLRDPAQQFKLFRGNALAYLDSWTATLARLQLFHTPPSRPVPMTQARPDDRRIQATWLQYARTDLPKKEDLAKQLDFHQVTAAMNSYPTLLRRLGLVVDFIIDWHLLTPAPDAPLSTAVTFKAGALTVPRARDASPITHAHLSDTAFHAVSNPFVAPGGFRVLAGLLDLDPHRFAMLQADVDGAGLKLMSFARSLQRLRPDEERVEPVTRFEKELGTPSLRTAGLVLVQRGRGAMLQDRFTTNKTKDDLAKAVFEGQPNAAPPQLWAEDLVRGFRFDVWDATTGLWRSLCRRTATYELDDGAVVVNPATGEEEGTVRLAATRSADPTSNRDIVYLHEAVVSWTGWSLAASPPGRAVLPDGTVDRTQPQTEAELPPGLKFRSRFRAVRGSLPRLRFGRHYWMRARAVDLAGNSPPPQEGDFGPENPHGNAQPFLRYEPIAAPVIALVKQVDGKIERPREGESMLRIAIRSFNDTPADNTIPTTQVARRFAVPSQVSARDTEYHGKLDSSGKVDPTTFDLLANQKDRDAKDPNAALVEELLPIQAPLGGTPVHTVFAAYRDGRALTYLPDPLAETVAVRIFGHPGVAETAIIRIPLYPSGSWPNAQPFKIEVFEDQTATPHYDATSHTLHIPLAKADRATVRISMQLSKRALHEVMGLWRWVPDADQAALEPLALDGQHWMLTPWRAVEVVHAVQRPLIAPAMVRLAIDRWTNDTSAVPRLVAACSVKSTDRVDLLAEWHEPSDDPSAAESEAIAVDRARGDVAFSLKITDPLAYAQKIHGYARGGIPEHTIEGKDLIGVGTPHDLVLVKHHEFHDTRYRRIEYWLEATTKFREYMPAGILTELVAGDPTPTEKNIRVIGPRTVTWIPSSAPPPAPEVLYVVPTFGWVRTRDQDGNASSWRRGGGLRVYLNRPWNVSGYGEMLAVVLPPPSFGGDPDTEPKGRAYKKFVTLWGNDPIWRSPFVAGLAPKASDFPLARTALDAAGAWLPKNARATEADQPAGPFQVTGLLPPGVPIFSGDVSVEIAPHDVFYDEERRLWYCDIEINQGGSYWPFIRLALARYQPVSVPGAHLSDVVLADFMPLAADRWLTVSRTRGQRNWHVTVFGHSYSASSGNREAAAAPSMSVIDPLTHTVRDLSPAHVAPTSIIEVWMEQLDPVRGEDFGWERVPDAVVQPTESAASGAVSPAGLAATPALRFVPADQIVRGLELHWRRRFSDLAVERLVDTISAFLPLWEGNITLPGEPGGDARFRLVIAEFEEYLVDDERPYGKVPTKKDRRLVFVEHIEL
jgi:hypothetical protein